MINPRFQKALKEIEKLNEEKNYLLEVIQTLKLSLHKANHKINSLLGPKERDHWKEAEEAMKRYTNKLRKESAQYAKQKQSKRK